MSAIAELVGELTPIAAGRAAIGLSDEEIRQLASIPARGAPSLEFYRDQRPRHEVEVAAFRLMRTPLTNAAFAQFVVAGGYRDIRLWSEMIREQGPKFRAIIEAEMVDTTGRPGASTWAQGRCPAGKEQHPVEGICVYEALAVARFFGLRLPTEVEWEYAARQPDWRVAPWRRDVDSHELGNFRELGRRGTTAIGAFPAGASAAGLLDLAGNVWEWTSSVYGPYPGGGVREQLGAGRLDRVARGGSWRESFLSCTCCARFALNPRQRFVGLGVRLAQ